MRFKLTKRQNRLVALGAAVMAPAIVFWLSSQVMTHSKKEIPVGHIGSELTETQERPQSKPVDAPGVTGKKKAPEKAWGRDPFKLSRGVKLKVAEQGGSPKGRKVKSKKGSPKGTSPPIKKVTAILISGSRKVASINHKVVVVGDLIDGEKVLEIEPDRVILGKGGRKHVIMLKKSPVQYTKSVGKEHEK